MDATNPPVLAGAPQEAGETVPAIAEPVDDCLPRTDPGHTATASRASSCARPGSARAGRRYRDPAGYVPVSRGPAARRADRLATRRPRNRDRGVRPGVG